MKRQTFLGGAAVIAAGGFVAKLIGALYRIPLTNLIGGHGMGLYQMVYPFYCLLLTVSATGIPSSVAKLTAEKRAAGASDRALLKSAFKLFLSIGAAGTLFMALFAPLLSALQGSPELKGGYFALAPAVFFVSGISVLRGWFQGRNNMFPTAFSEVAEQVVKVGFGLLFAYLYRGDVQKAVTFILLSVSLSELFALLLMLFLFRREKNPFEGLKEGGRAGMKGILRLSIPATLASAVLPLSSLAESVIVVRLLKGYTSDAVGLYGLFSGGGGDPRQPPRLRLLRDRGGERARRFGGGSGGRGRAQKGTARPFRDAGGEHPLRRRAVLSGGHGGGVGLPRAFGGGSRDADETDAGHGGERGDAVLHADPLRLPHGAGQAGQSRPFDGDRGGGKAGARLSARLPPGNFRLRRGDRGGRLLFGCFCARFGV